MSLLGRGTGAGGCVLPCIPPGTDNDGRREDRRGLLLMLGVRSNGRPRARIPSRRAFVAGPSGGTPALMTEQGAGQQGTRDRTGAEAGDLGAGSARSGEESHPDTGKREQHDQQGRSGETGGPYVEAGRDEQGRPQPAVPHEGLLGRIATSLLAGPVGGPARRRRRGLRRRERGRVLRPLGRDLPGAAAQPGAQHAPADHGRARPRRAGTSEDPARVRPRPGPRLPDPLRGGYRGLAGDAPTRRRWTSTPRTTSCTGCCSCSASS